MKHYCYNVEWIGDHFTASTTVLVPVGESDAAIGAARQQMMELYGWDMESAASIEEKAEFQYEEDV